MKEVPADSPGDAQAGTEACRATPSQLLQLARGFACIFWGIPLALLLFFNTIRFHFWARIPLPAYVMGVALIYLGMVSLYAAGNLTPRWTTRVRTALFVLFLHVYFAPFVHWWQRAPYVPYYFVNVIGLLFCAMWLLLVVNQLAGDVAAALGDRTFRVEAGLCAWSVLVLLLLPFALSFLYSLQAALRNQSNLYLEMLQLHEHGPRWIFVLGLLPFTLTMASSWKAKGRCLRALKGGV